MDAGAGSPEKKGKVVCVGNEWETGIVLSFPSSHHCSCLLNWRIEVVDCPPPRLRLGLTKPKHSNELNRPCALVLGHAAGAVANAILDPSDRGLFSTLESFK